MNIHHSNTKGKEMRSKIHLFIASLLFVTSLPASAQNFALKTNLLSDAFTNMTAIAEVGLAPRWSAQVGGSLNITNFESGKRWKHWSAMPEVRYWFCDHFLGHFVGAHVFGGQYNVGGLDINMKLLGTDFSKLKDNRYQGWYVGAGIAYGYAWGLSRHWNLETEVGVGYAYTRYDKFRCANCGKKIEEDKPHHYVGPTKAALNLVYIF